MCSGLPESRRQHWQEHDRHESPDHGDARGIAPPASAERRHQRLIHRPAKDYAQSGNRSHPQSARDDAGVATHGTTYGCCERSRSAARELGLSIRTVFVASPLHRLVRLSRAESSAFGCRLFVANHFLESLAILAKCTGMNDNPLRRDATI